MSRTLPVVVMLLLAVPMTTRARTTITIDGNITYQTMSGWECTTFIVGPCTAQATLVAVRDTVLELAVNDVGINRVRLEVRSGVENPTDFYQAYVDAGCPEPPSPEYQTWRANRYATVNDNADPDVIDWAGFHFTELDWTIEEVVLPMRALLEARGEELFVNLCYVAFTGQIQGGGYHHDDAAEYAELVVATHVHMNETYGFVPDSWEVILEPDNVAQWNGTLIGEAIAAAGAELQANSFSPRFAAPSNSTMSQILGYFDDMIAVPSALDYLDTFSYHRYGSNTSTLAAMAQRAEQNGLDMGMLEWWFGNADYEVLHEDLTLGRNSAWQGRTLGSLVTVDASDPDALVVDYPRDTMYNRQYFKHVRRGARRVGAASDDGSVDPVAFRGADDRFVVVVKSVGGDTLEIHALPAGTYGVFYTTGVPQQPPTAYDVELPDVVIADGEVLVTAIPGPGLLTVHGRTGSVAVDQTPYLPGVVRLVPRPNPFAGEATIGYTLAHDADVALDVFDVAGRHIGRLGGGPTRAGRHAAHWRAGSAAPGVYLLRLTIDGRVAASEKLVRAR